MKIRYQNNRFPGVTNICYLFTIYSNRKRKTSTSSLTNGFENSPNQNKSGSKISNGSDSCRSDTIALGTSSGSILIYSLKSGDITSSFSKESSHNGRVNDIVSTHSYTKLKKIHGNSL